MFTISIDVGAFQKVAGSYTQAVLEEAVDSLGAFAHDRLLQEAASRLSPASVQAYQSALSITRQPHQVTVALDGAQAEGLEEGTTGFDIKVGLLNSAKVKQGKTGPYIDVPLPVDTRKIVGSRRKIFRAAVAEARRTGAAQRIFKQRHTSGPTRRMADMQVRPDEAITFRRVSQATPASSWLYPSRPGLGAFAKVASEVEHIAPQVMHDILQRHLP